MPQASSDYNLYVLDPDLIKEWHPTRNAGIKPQEVTPGSGRKIWWLCREGHEWQAVVYSRSRGSGCPICKRANPLNVEDLAVSDSDIRTEWHPTANGRLNPTCLTAEQSARVWWICDQGHEWRATFKARLKGEGCPICGQQKEKKRPATGSFPGSLAETIDSTPEMESLESFLGTDFRKIQRFKTKATVTIQVPDNNHLFYAHMKNFSREGMCIETSTALPPGTKVNIKLDRPLFASSTASHVSIIRWCEELTDEEGTVYNYGLGLKFI